MKTEAYTLASKISDLQGELADRWQDPNSISLTFDNEFFGQSESDLGMICKVTHVVYPILMLQEGKLTSFGLEFDGLKSCVEIDAIVLFLAQKHPTLSTFNLQIAESPHLLKEPFFSLKNLIHLTLQQCIIEPSNVFEGFGRLETLRLWTVSISPVTVYTLFEEAPTLECLELMIPEDLLLVSEEVTTNTWSEAVCLLPNIRYLKLSVAIIRFFADSDQVEKQDGCPFLEDLQMIGTDFDNATDVQTMYFFVTLSSNLKTLAVLLNSTEEDSMDEPVEVTSYGIDFEFDCLGALKIANLKGSAQEMTFIEFIFNRSSQLKKVELSFAPWVTEVVKQERKEEVESYKSAAELAAAEIDWDQD